MKSVNSPKNGHRLALAALCWACVMAISPVAQAAPTFTDASWTSMGSGISGYINSVVRDGAGNVYVGGVFTSAGGVTANSIAKWNGNSWTNLGSPR